MKKCVAMALAVGLLAPLGSARAEDPEAPVVEEILGVLQERGLLDPSEHDRLVTRYQEQEADRRNALPKIRFSGDLRLRGESFWYDEDASGDDPSNRYRGRYRLRIAADAEVNEYVYAHLRLASGESNDPRSRNVSFGRPDPDFDSDPIWIDRAYVELLAPARWLPEGASASVEVGKMGNPFIWKAARDFMLWDGDITPEGVAVRLRGEALPGVDVFATSAYYVDDENSSASDPHLVAAQLGTEWETRTPLSGGARVSWYGFRSLDSAFVQRGVDGEDSATNSGGNIADGLTDGSDPINVGELGTYLRWTGFESWPITLFGYLSKNFSAQQSELAPDAGSEALAWGTGLEVGDRKAYVALGLGYWSIEANAFPSQFIDSNLFDGVTNREGWAFWGSRQLLPNTDFNVTLFWSDAIDDQLPDFDDSVPGSDRLRLQTDLIVSF